MAKPGPKPKPAAMRVLEGNPSKRPLPLHAPKPKARFPSCPRFLKGEARSEWYRLAKLLRPLHYICPLDRGVLIRHCIAHAEFIDAFMIVHERGPVVGVPMARDPEKVYPMISPYYSVMQAAEKRLNATMAELGLSPSSRMRINVEMLSNGEEASEEEAHSRYGL